MESAAALPAMGIVTYRPGYRAPWMDRSYVTQVALPPLSREDSLSVVRSVRRADAVSDRVAEVILAKAEGNPFFLEELSRVVDAPSEFAVRRPQVPDTIQEVLLARIDRLAETPRRLLQTAAVFGQEVPLRAPPGSVGGRARSTPPRSDAPRVPPLRSPGAASRSSRSPTA